MPVLLAGLPNNEARPGHEDQRAFPDALCAALEMPLAMPYRGIDVERHRPDEAPFLDAWYGLLANIYGVSRHAIEARDRQRRTTDRRIASRELTGAGLDALGRDPELAARLAAHAVWLTLEHEGSLLPEAEALLHRAVFGVERRRTVPVARLTGHQGAVWDVRFSPDGSMLATASEDQQWALWRRDGTPIGATAGNTPAGPVKAIRFTPDGTQVFTAHLGRQAKLWSVSTGAGRGRLTASADVLDVAISPDGRLVAMASLDGVAEVYELATGTRVQRLVHTHGPVGASEPAPIVSIAFSTDGSLLITAGTFGIVRIWDIASGALRLDLAGHDEVVMDVAVDATAAHVATASDDSTWRLWDATSGALRLQRPASPPPSRDARAKQAPMCLAFDPTGGRVATGHRDKSVRVWDVHSGEEVLHLQGHTGGVWGVDFSPDGRELATASYDRTVGLWDLDLDAPAYATLGGHAGTVAALAFSQDGSRLFSGSWDTTCRSVEVATGREIFRIEGQTGTVHGLALSPDGRVLATAGGNTTARLWDAGTGHLRRTVEGHERDVLSVAFSADGRRLLTASDDGSARLWDVETGALVRRFAGAHPRVVAAAFALGDTRIVTAGTADPHDSAHPAEHHRHRLGHRVGRAGRHAERPRAAADGSGRQPEGHDGADRRPRSHRAALGHQVSHRTRRPQRAHEPPDVRRVRAGWRLDGHGQPRREGQALALLVDRGTRHARALDGRGLERRRQSGRPSPRDRRQGSADPRLPAGPDRAHRPRATIHATPRDEHRRVPGCTSAATKPRPCQA